MFFRRNAATVVNSPAAIFLLFTIFLSSTGPEAAADVKTGTVAGRILVKGGGPLSWGEVMLYDASAGPPPMPEPMQERDFYFGYRERLENKLRHKNTQIARTERLLQTLPKDQKPAFEALLLEARRHRQEIEEELNELYQLIDTTKQKS